jgi:hypothetical protein
VVQLLAVAQRSMLRWTQGRIGEVEEDVRRFADAAPGIVGWRAALARIYCDLGREAEARRELERLDEEGFANLPRYNGWMNMIALLAEVCRHLGDVDRARALYPLLLPFERRNVVVPQSSFDGPVSRYLGILAATSRDWDTAAQHFEHARHASERVSARPFVALIDVDEAAMLVDRGEPSDAGRALVLLTEAREIAGELDMEKIVEQVENSIAELGDVGAAEASGQKETDPAPVEATAQMRRDGDLWQFRFEERTLHIRESKGVRYLALLLANPGVEIHSIELAGSPPDVRTRNRRELIEDMSVTVTNDAGPALDSKAKGAYRRRLDELQEEIDEAESFNDPERAAKARDEIDFLTKELADAVGLGGRDRKIGSNAERARVAVTKAVRTTLKRIAEMDAGLGQELTATIRTGTYCCYEPDRRRPVSWEVEDETQSSRH